MKLKLLITGIVLVFSQLLYAQSKNETTALQWIEANKETLEIQDHHEFQMLFNRKGLAGETFRYYQFVNDVQVFDASIAISLDTKGKVTYHASTYDKTVALINTTPTISEADALQTALLKMNVLESDMRSKESKLYVYNKLESTKLVYRVVIASNNKVGYWENIVDANSGEVLSSKDVAIYHNKKEDLKKKEDPKEKIDPKKKAKKQKKSGTVFLGSVDGSGMVFDTDPLTATTSPYGGNYQDNNDNTNAQLNAARTQVVLLDIEQTGASFKLEGPYVEISDFEAPNTGLFVQNSSTFNFTRDQQGFEAVNCYYHLDKTLRYINETLGISLAPTTNGGVLLFDPHGLNGQDNSHYFNGHLAFGEGCVDDAEDADVILHEFGHGLHDFATNGSAANGQGLGEGSGDYWANSYKRNLGLWATSDAANSYVFGWDGHNFCWPGRSTTVTNTYPGGLGGGIHAEGQIWASSLMEIWEIIGKEKMDKAFIEGLAMTNSNTNQPNAAFAVRQAAINMMDAGGHGFTCTDIDAFSARFAARGYSLIPYNCTSSASVNEFELNDISIYPNPTASVINLSNINKDYTVEIHNVLGQQIKTVTINQSNSSIDVSNLNDGIYLIKFNGSLGALKFIKK